MTFRNDHDAAIARADALERELETAKASAATAEQRLGDEQAERQRLETTVAELRAKQPVEPTPAFGVVFLKRAAIVLTVAILVMFAILLVR